MGFSLTSEAYEVNDASLLSKSRVRPLYAGLLLESSQLNKEHKPESLEQLQQQLRVVGEGRGEWKTRRNSSFSSLWPLMLPHSIDVLSYIFINSQTEYLRSPKIHMLKSKPQCEIFGSGAFRR